jgi:ribosomal-protein-alanine N-acetyltransferase
MELLETSRLRLEPLAPEHAAALYTIYSEPAVRRFLIGCTTTRTDFDGLFDSAVQFGRSHGMWAIRHKDVHGLVGRVGFFAFGASARPELAFLLSERFWGQGLATEASAATLTYGFTRHAWAEVVAVARPANVAAIRVLVKLGMALAGTVMLGGAAAALYQVARHARVSTLPIPTERKFEDGSS